MANYPSPLVNSNPNTLISIFGINELGEDVTTGSKGNGEGISASMGILSPMPETFTLSTMSEWHPVLDGLLRNISHTLIGGTNLGGVVEAALGAAGHTFGIGQSLALSQLLWQSTSPIMFNLPLLFNAVTDAYTEVTLPILQLLKLTLPSELNNTAGLLTSAPGPTLYNNKYNVNIAIGNMMIFTNVIIRSVSATFHTLPVDKGDFISADVNLEISTSRILSKNGLEAAFKLSGQFNTYKTSPGDAASSPTTAAGGGAAP